MTILQVFELFCESYGKISVFLHSKILFNLIKITEKILFSCKTIIFVVITFWRGFFLGFVRGCVDIILC